jgi:hypothetical protein
MNLSNEMRLDLEMSVMKKLVQDALAAGYAIRIYDGEAWTTREPLTNENKIIFDLRSTDEDQIYFYKNVDGKWKRFGFVKLIYGNMPYEVIADNTDTDEINNLLKGAEALQDALEEDLT